METRAHYVLVGAFTIVMAVLLMMFSLWVAKAQLNESYKVYEVAFQGPVRGLSKGNEVRFNGIKVGEVKKLDFDKANPQLVVAIIRVAGDTPVRTSSDASLEGIGLTGINLIQITAGDLKDPLLATNTDHPTRIMAKPGGLDDLVAAGQEMVTRANKTLAALQTVLSDENVKHLSDTIANVDRASAMLGKEDGALDRVSAAAKSITALSDDTRGKLDHFADRADGTFDKIDHAASSIAEAADNSKKFVATAQDAADTAAYQALPDISNAARDLRRLSISLQQLTNDADSGAFSLIPGGGASKPTVKVDQ